MILLALAWKSHDDIGGNSDTLACVSDAANKIDIFLRRIGSVHRFKNSVGTGLQRQMNVLSHLRQTRDRVDQIATETNGMRGSKPEPFEALNFINRFQQLHKGTFALAFRELVAAIQIYDLPEQRDFLHSACDQVAHLSH